MFYTEPKLTLLSRPSFAEPEHLPVTWIGESTDGERLAEFAGRLCYMSQRNPASRTTREYLENIKRQGHGSVLEHANYSILVEGVSRSLTHELVRHRAGMAYCLDGDTLVYSEHRWGGRPNGTKKRTIRRLYEMTLTPHGRSRLKLLRLRCLDETTGAFTTGRVRSVVRSGVKPVFRVELEDGKSITCTREHRFLTPDGWQPLEAVVGGLSVSPGGHALVGRAGGTLLTNGVAAYRDREWLRSRYHEDGLQQSEIAELVGVTEHCVRAWVRKHGLQKPVGSGMAGRRPWNAGVPYTAGWKRSSDSRRLLLPRPRRIVGVSYVGERETYDIEMDGPNHNFVANGIVTHNSQLSQRYVDESEANFVVPPAIIGDEALEQAWRTQIEAAQWSYTALVEQLMERYGWVGDKVHRRKMAREAARGVLPNSTETKIVVTGNARAWRTVLELRSSEGAELEIRRLAVALLRLLQREAPAFFNDFEIYTGPDRREAARIGYHKV